MIYRLQQSAVARFLAKNIKIESFELVRRTLHGVNRLQRFCGISYGVSFKPKPMMSRYPSVSSLAVNPSPFPKSRYSLSQLSQKSPNRSANASFFGGG